jgi:uncharacterized membrane protein YdbT with pleckstrin-like domain
VSYVEKNLIPGEEILFRTRHHWVVMLGMFAGGTLLSLAGIAGLVYLLTRHGVDATSRNAGLLASGVAVIGGSLLTLYGTLKQNATEMLVTNKRVIVKTGILARKTFEMLLSRIESIGVEEPVLGRMLGYGTVILRGVGGTPDEFDLIAQPLAFRSHVQEQIEAGRKIERRGD